MITSGELALRSLDTAGAGEHAAGSEQQMMMGRQGMSADCEPDCQQLRARILFAFGSSEPASWTDQQLRLEQRRIVAIPGIVRTVGVLVKHLTAHIDSCNVYDALVSFSRVGMLCLAFEAAYQAYVDEV
jgi:hypothetical protein